MNRLQLWSDIPGQWYKASTESDATGQAGKERQSGETVRVERVNSLDLLIKLLTRLCDENTTWDAVNFHTHGAGGSIALGATSLDFSNYNRLENQDFSRLFNKDCVITFDGCNVGEGSEGEYFLIEIARTLLIAQGGRVRGSTGAGFGSWGGSESIHPLGGWVTVHIAAGASIRLENGTHLHSGHIQERINQLHGLIESMDKGGAFQPGEKQELENVERNARAWGPDKDWHNRFKACLWLERAEEKIFFINQRNHPKRPLGAPVYR